MGIGLGALLWLNVRVRWREWQTAAADGVFLRQMRALWAAEVIRPHRARPLRLVRSTLHRVLPIARRLQTPSHAQSFETFRHRSRRQSEP